MSDGISDAYREQERYERWMERREAACVVLNVVLSPVAIRKRIAKQYFTYGRVMPEEKARERIQLSRGDRQPYDWSAACRLLGADDPLKVPMSGEEYSPVVEAAMRQLGVLESSSADPDQAFFQLEGQDAPVWARLLHSLEQDDGTNGRWRDRLQALSPFADKVVFIFEPSDFGPGPDYIVSLAKAKGQYLETSWATRYGGETNLRVAVVPRVDALQ